MARGINKTISIGNLCADPESRAMPNGNAVTNVRIAMNESYKDKNTGQVVERVEYMSVVFFNRLAEIAGQYLKRGSQVYIEGSLRTRKWTDQNGQDRYTTEIVANEMQLLDSKPKDGHQPTQKPSNNKSHPDTQASSGFDDFDDSIPF